MPLPARLPSSRQSYKKKPLNLMESAQKTVNLSNFMDGHQLCRAGPPTLVRYDPPWMPWFLRRNEIMVPIQPADVLP
jgi:hypothetical protein